MTVKHEFRCNLCGDEIVPYEKPGRHGVGIEFRESNAVRFRLLHDANHHLCDICIRGVRIEADEFHRIDKAQSGEQA